MKSRLSGWRTSPNGAWSPPWASIHAYPQWMLRDGIWRECPGLLVPFRWVALCL